LSQQLKSAIQYGIIGLIGAFFLYFVFKGTDWNDLLLKFEHTNYWWIAAGMSISVLSHYIRAYRATMLYEVLDYNVKVSNSFYAVMIGYMMNYIIPRAGEVSRCAALTKTDDIPVNKSLGTVVTERIFDMVILLLMLVVVFVFQFDLLTSFITTSLQSNNNTVAASGPNLKLIILIALAAGAMGVYLIRKKLASNPLFVKITGLLMGFGEGLLSIRKVKKPLVFVLLSIAIWLCYVLMMYFCLFAMEATASLTFMDCLTVFVIGSIGMIIPAPGAGAGTYHFAVMQSLLLFGVAETDGIAYATIVHGIQMILLLAIGAVCSLIVLAQHKKRTS
jgi:uncharacterized protein (TIRG00374 family)